MRYISKKSFEALLRTAEQQGWDVKRSTKGWKLIPPDKTKSMVVIHGTPSDHRVYKNTVTQLRKSGLVI